MSVVKLIDLPLLDATEAGGLLGIPPKTVRQYAREGRLPAVYVGRRVAFSRRALEQTLGEAMAAGHRI